MSYTIDFIIGKYRCSRLVAIQFVKMQVIQSDSWKRADEAEQANDTVRLL